jgi:hypothetical protein
LRTCREQSAKIESNHKKVLSAKIESHCQN